MISTIRILYRTSFRKVFGNKHHHLHWLLAILCVSPLSFFDISIEIEKKESYASVLGVTTQITDYGITWSFKDPVQYGQYITGDYWVVGPVEIVAASPDYIPGHHGLELNPSNPNEQPYDDRSNKYGTGGLLSLPYVAQGGDSIIKTISFDPSIVGCRPCVLEASVLTVVNSIHSDDAFRPSYASDNKKEYKISDIDWSKLPSVEAGNITYPKYSGTLKPDYSQDGGSIPDLETTAGYFTRFWPDHMSDYHGRSIHPENHMPDYGGDMYKQIGTALLRTMLDDSISEKENTVVKLLQYAIDLEGSMISTGTRFNGNGGHTGGRKMLLAYAGVLFNDQEIKSFIQNAEAHYFNEEDQNYFSPKAGLDSGMALLGDETSGSEAQYWDLLEDGNGFRTNRDPYGYIDGGYRAGDAYLIPINAGLWKSDVVAMILMPELKPVYNDANFEEVTYRYVNHGKWTQPDPCAPFDGNINNRGITYGPDGSGGCILDTDASDGIGRYPDLHGTDTDAGAYSRYRVPLADRLWDKYITNGETIIDNSSGLGGSSSSSSSGSSSGGGGQNDFSSIGTIPVISYGQSVSVGAGGTISPDAHGPENHTWSQYISSMNSAQDDFVTLASINDRSHDQGMLEVVVNNFLADYGDSPNFISLRSGVGGKSIQELAIRPEHIFSGSTLANAANIVPTEYSFALYNGDKYDIYIDDGSLTPTTWGVNRSKPVYYGNMISDFQDLKSIADVKGETLSDTIMFNWTQGQSNTAPLPYGYDQHLARIIDMLETDISQIYGKQVKVVSMINQLSRYSYTTPTAQLKLIRDRNDVHFGYPEYAYNVKYPQRNTDPTGGHLNSLGYRLMGENMGYQLYDILTQGYSENPHISSYIYDSSASQLTLNFGGISGTLIEDDSIITQTYTPEQTITTFVEDVQSYFPESLDNAGVSVGTSGISVTDYSISNNSVILDIDNPTNKDFELRFGEINNGTIISPLRDTKEYSLIVPAANYGDTSVHKVRFHTYLQNINISSSENSLVDLTLNTNATPYFSFDEPQGPTDIDSDTIPDSIDNCPNHSNVTQLNTDGDAVGNACDPDDDNDGVNDDEENSGCMLDPDPDCGVITPPSDLDQDTISDTTDNCINIRNVSQADFDDDRIGDACDSDDDNDGILDVDETSGCDFLSDVNCGVVISSSSSSSSSSSNTISIDTLNKSNDLDVIFKDILDEDELEIDLTSAPEYNQISDEVDTSRGIPVALKNIPETRTDSGLVQRVAKLQNKSQVGYEQTKSYLETCPTVQSIQGANYNLESSADYVFSDEGISSKRLKIRKMHALGIISGFNDGSFKPNTGVTRTEFLKILLKTHCYDYQDENTQALKYVDVNKSSWQAKVISKAEDLGLISGDTDTNNNSVFRANDTITKLEALKIILNMSELQVEQRLRTNYNDVYIPWHRKYIETAESLGLYDAYLEGQTFDVNASVKREDMIDLIDRVIQLYK